jgi:hypothetical protein
MTINLSDNSPRISYSVADGVTQTSFTVPFEFFDNNDLNVYVDGVLKTLTTDYTVSGGDGSTGTVTITVTGASGGSTVVITRDIDLERTTDFPTSGPFQIAALNTELDRITAIAADLDDRAARALQLTDYDADANLTLPDLDTRKGKTLAFNEITGAAEAGPSTSDVQSVSNNAADIALLADIEDGTLATNAITNVNTIRADVTTVANIDSNVATVASISANVTTVAGDSADIQAVASDSVNIGTVAANISDVNTAATNITDIQNASTNAATATTKAAEAATSATSASTAQTAAETAKTGAETAQAAAETAQAAAAASQTAAANSAASAAAAFDNFDDTYLGSKTSDPTTDNDGDPLTSGDLYFNSTANEMRVYDGANWIAATSAGNVSLLNYNYTATASQTTFSGADDNAATLSYTQQNLIVTLNGIVLEDGTDYTANNGTSVVLASGAAAGDELNIVSFKSFTTADMVPASTGGTFSGNVTMTADLTVDTNTLHVDSTNNRVGIGTSSPATLLHVESPDDGTVAKFVCTDADANVGPVVQLYRNSPSPAVNDQIGQIQFIGKNSADEDITYTALVNQIKNETDGNEQGRFALNTYTNGTLQSRLNILNEESVFNEDGLNIDFRVEGEALSHLFFIDADDNQVFVGNNTEGGSNVRFNINSNDFQTIPFSCYRPYNASSGALMLAQSDVGGTQSTVFSIKTDGDVENLNNSYGSLSDERLKQQIADAANQWDDIKSLQVRKYKLNGSVEHDGDENTPFHIGVVAQELEAAGLGGLVKTDDETGMKSVKYSILYMKAVKALQEAMERIETLETENIAIKARLDALESNT